jgi:predicted transporter
MVAASLYRQRLHFFISSCSDRLVLSCKLEFPTELVCVEVVLLLLFLIKAGYYIRKKCTVDVEARGIRPEIAVPRNT